MLNEVLQWLVIVLAMVLTLGTYRYIGSQSASYGAGEQFAGPPEGKLLPKEARRLLDRTGGGDNGQPTTLVFVTESCRGCRKLLAEVEAQRGTLSRSRRILIVAGPDSSDAFVAKLRSMQVDVFVDRDAGMWGDCNIVVTPLIVNVDSHGRVEAKRIATSLVGMAARSSDDKYLEEGHQK